jgi:hypothetical protein
VLAGDRPETIGHYGDHLCRTEQKVAIVGNDARQAIEHIAPGLAVEHINTLRQKTMSKLPSDEKS